MSLTGHSDTVFGSRLNPIATEKDWLIYAVRGLSHTAAGRAQGKEIWGEKWKPPWWDTVCLEQWKNPTTGKKDSIKILKTKCICLEKKLREIGKFPHELEQEFQLWKDRKLEKLYEVIKWACIEAQCTKTYSSVKESDRSIKEKKGKVDIIDFDFEHTYQMVFMTYKIIKRLKEMSSLQNHQTTLNESTLTSSTSNSKRGLDEEEDCTGLSRLAAKRPRLTPTTQVSTLPSTSSSSASCRYSPSLLPLTVETTQSFKNKTHVPEKQQTTHTSSGIELERTSFPCVARQADQFESSDLFVDPEDSGMWPSETGIFPPITDLVMSSEVSRQAPHQDHDETVKRDTATHDISTGCVAALGQSSAAFESRSTSSLALSCNVETNCFESDSFAINRSTTKNSLASSPLIGIDVNNSLASSPLIRIDVDSNSLASSTLRGNNLNNNSLANSNVKSSQLTDTSSTSISLTDNSLASSTLISKSLAHSGSINNDLSNNILTNSSWTTSYLCPTLACNTVASSTLTDSSNSSVTFHPPITDEELEQLLRKNLGSPTSMPTDNSIDNTANDSSINTTNVDQALHPKKDITGSSTESKSKFSTPLEEQDLSFDLSPGAMTEVDSLARSFVKEILQE